jgi:hypothetical protein
VEPKQLDAYVPNALDIQIAEAILNGAISFVDIGAQLEAKPATISKYMEDPVVVGWIGREIQQHIEKRLFLVSASMFQRAIAGDVSAAKLILERFGQLVHRSESIVHKGMDLQRLSDEELDRALQDHGIQVEARVVADGAGESTTPAEGADAVLPAAPEAAEDA